MPRTPAVARRKLLNALPNLLVFIVTFAHVFVSPYTKVEESFTLHAVHDVLRYMPKPWIISQYDHVQFPGAVPRSFLLPLLLGYFTYPLSAAGVALGLIRRKMDVQILIRLALATLHGTAFNHLQKTIRRKYGAAPRAWFLALSLSQFHIPYYAGRTLPNFMIMPIVMLSISWILRSTFTSSPETVRHRQRGQAIAWLTRIATNTRLELAAFVLPLALGLVLTRRVGFGEAIYHGAIGGFSALLASAALDYLLWSAALPHPSVPSFTQGWQFAWPEMASFHYNVFQGQSANWGVMSKHYYFTNSLPKLLMGSLPLVGLGVMWGWLEGLGLIGAVKSNTNGNGGRGLWKAIRELFSLFGLGVVGLVGSMSLVGHKEWRFIVYVVPIFNIVAAITAASLWTASSSLRPLIRLGLVGLVLANVAGTIGFTFVSSQNYPGGDVSAALERLQRGSHDTVKVHYHSYPLQTGASLFTFDHLPAPPGPFPAFPPAKEPEWVYSKSESPGINTPEGAWKEGVDYVVTEDWTTYAHYDGGRRWEVAQEITGFAGVRRGGKFLIEPRWGTKAAILRRIG